ncbi:TatD family deoxyribonuclease [Pseudoprevotella muciniphila]|uniref:TatD family deoxyribonuclease n=1 Tax=Pseudoprevotella muciniphila TaxID=2133944 RepID=A0A5P8E8B1_9BACT|nr:TatD family hydrolase [Pseudoprevotella muciniphila]QFQ13117.1 TatD family deoxyribonuclease [Pseudoprevotella muciniphila]
MSYIDTHTHLYTEEFDADRKEVVERAVLSGAQCILLPNIDEASIAPMLRMCRDYPRLCYPMMGLHPTDIPEDPWPLLNRMEQLLAGGDYVAVGEVGVDLYWDDSRRDVQIDVFRHQVEWAVKFQLPLVIHSRNAQDEIVSTLLPYRDELCGGIFHCFGGTKEEAEELLDFPNFMLGIGGVITFKKSSLPEFLKTTVPLSRIVLETDAPYLAPTPHRGKRNESSYIPLIISKLAEIYATDANTIEAVTTHNAKTIFKKIT